MSFDYVFVKKEVKRKYGSHKAFAKAITGIGYTIKQEAVTKWFQGKTAPKVGAMPYIAEALDLSILELFDGTDTDIESLVKKELVKNIDKYLAYLPLKNEAEELA